MNDLGTTLRRIRQGRGLTLDQVATSLGVKRQAVSKWELGGTDLPISRLSELGALLGFTLAIDDSHESLDRKELRRLISLADDSATAALLGVARHLVKDL